MLKVTLWHTPQYFSFNVRDSAHDDMFDRRAADEMVAAGFAMRPGIILVGVKSDCTSIPIAVEYDATGLEAERADKWDRIFECSLCVSGKAIIFESSTGGEFGRLDVKPGGYRLRVHCGGQDAENDDGDIEDFYLIQIWPASLIPVSFAQQARL